VLLERFVKADGEAPKVTPGQKRDVLKLASQHGRENFLRAADAWIASHPWNNRTTDPLLTFISGFAGYLSQANHKDEANARREKLKAEMHIHSAIAAKQSQELWGPVPVKPDVPEPPAEEFLEEDPG